MADLSISLSEMKFLNINIINCVCFRFLFSYKMDPNTDVFYIWFNKTILILSTYSLSVKVYTSITFTIHNFWSASSENLVVLLLFVMSFCHFSLFMNRWCFVVQTEKTFWKMSCLSLFVNFKKYSKTLIYFSVL